MILRGAAHFRESAAVPANSVYLLAPPPGLTCCHWPKASSRLGREADREPAAVHPRLPRGRIPGMRRKPPAAPGAGQVTGCSPSLGELPPSTKAAPVRESRCSPRRQSALCSWKSTLSLPRLGGGGEATQEAGLVGRARLEQVMAWPRPSGSRKLSEIQKFKTGSLVWVESPPGRNDLSSLPLD